VTATIYIEGGAKGKKSNYLNTKCQEAFHKLLDKMGFTGRKPRLVACGGRQNVFDKFCTKLKTTSAEYIAMWIDSEEPMQDIDNTWQHLAAVTTVAPWTKPVGANDDQVLFMATCMETWIVTDRNTLLSHYGKSLHEKHLPALNNVESLGRDVVQNQLIQATKSCDKPYAKGNRHSKSCRNWTISNCANT
jgi:hypothetical protein